MDESNCKNAVNSRDPSKSRNANNTMNIIKSRYANYRRNIPGTSQKSVSSRQQQGC
jgi:hypothetical protein